MKSEKNTIPKTKISPKIITLKISETNHNFQQEQQYHKVSTMKIYPILIMLAAALLPSLTSAAAVEEEFDYELNPGIFNKLKVTNSVNVVYTASPDSAGRAVFRAPKSMADFFIISNNNGTINVESLPVASGTTGLPTLYIYSEFLGEVQNYGDSTVTVRNVTPSAKFKAVQVGNGRITVDQIKCSDLEAFLNTGNGTIAISGQCYNAKFRMVGTGLIQADNLSADYVRCTILGGGTIGCWPRFELNVKGIGSTKIYYKGNPVVSKKGGGKLMRLESYDVEDNPVPSRSDALPDNDNTGVSQKIRK